MGRMLQPHRRVMAALSAALTLLFLSCPSRDKSTDDTAVCVPGYGTLGLSFVMADAYSESVIDELDYGLTLALVHVDDPLDSCADYRWHYYEHVAVLKASLDLVTDFQVPVGQTCGYTDGEAHADEQPGYYIGCGGDLDLTIVRECERVEAVMIVTCELYESVDTSDGA